MGAGPVVDQRRRGHVLSALLVRATGRGEVCELRGEVAGVAVSC